MERSECSSFRGARDPQVKVWLRLFLCQAFGNTRVNGRSHVPVRGVATSLLQILILCRFPRGLVSQQRTTGRFFTKVICLKMIISSDKTPS